MPAGIKVISILYYIGSAIAALTGLMMIFGASFFIQTFAETAGLPEAGAGIIRIVGVISIAVGIISFFIAKNIGRGKNWARITAIVFAAIGALQAVIEMINGAGTSIVILALDAFIIYYLGFSKEGKGYFKR